MQVYPPTVRVIRVTRADTLMIRVVLPHIGQEVSQHMVLEGVECSKGCRTLVLDWVELHQEPDGLYFINADWLRDSYGRLVGDLQDIQTGETLTQYLLEQCAAKTKPWHVNDVIKSLLRAEAPE